MKELQNAANELSEFLGLEPKIKTVGVKKEALEKAVTEATELLEDGEKEQLSKDTIKVIDSLLGEEPEETDDTDEAEEPEEKPAKKKAAKKKPAPKKKAKKEEPEEDPEEPEEPAEEPEETEEKPAPKKKAKKEKPAKEPSAYGTAITILATKPDMDSKELKKAMEKKGIDTAAKKNAITTALSQFHKVVGLLRENGYMD